LNWSKNFDRSSLETGKQPYNTTGLSAVERQRLWGA
jgi:hypothetical protein